MHEAHTPSDSSDEDGGGDFVFMDNIQAVVGTFNSWLYPQAPPLPGALSELGARPSSVGTPRLPVQTDERESRLRQVENRASLLNVETGSIKPKRALSKGVASFVASYEQRFGNSAADSPAPRLNSRTSIRPSVEWSESSPNTPFQDYLRDYAGPTQLTTELVYDETPQREGESTAPLLHSRAATPQTEPPTETPRTTLDENDWLGAPMSAPGTPISIPPDVGIVVDHSRVQVLPAIATQSQGQRRNETDFEYAMEIDDKETSLFRTQALEEVQRLPILWQNRAQMQGGMASGLSLETEIAGLVPTAVRAVPASISPVTQTSIQSPGTPESIDEARPVFPPGTPTSEISEIPAAVTPEDSPVIGPGSYSIHLPAMSNVQSSARPESLDAAKTPTDSPTSGPGIDSLVVTRWDALTSSDMDIVYRDFPAPAGFMHQPMQDAAKEKTILVSSKAPVSRLPSFKK